MSVNYWSRWYRIRREYGFLSLWEVIKYRIQALKADACLLDTPIHGNLGDHAIVQAQKQLLSGLGFKVLDIPQIILMNREKGFASVIPRNKTIFLPGGGFIGYLWPEEEYEVRKIIQSFPNHRIIIFPQTVTFDMETPDGREFMRVSHKIYSSHKNLTIFVRDTQSRDFMQEYMPDVKSIYVPDTVTMFRPGLPEISRHDILFSLRNDKEKAISDDMVTILEELVKKRFPGEKIRTTDNVVEGGVFPWMREERLSQKLMEYASAKLVITDRLHGMLMAAITNTHCIAFDNSNGKVGAQYEWIRRNSYIHMVHNMDELMGLVENMNLDNKYHYDYDSAEEMMKPLVEYITDTGYGK